MGFVQDMFENWRKSRQEEAEQPDDETRDKYLRSLRREQRILDEEEEKEYLKKEIARRKKIKLQRHMFGSKNVPSEDKVLNSKRIGHSNNILKGGHQILKQKGMLKDKKSFL